VTGQNDGVEDGNAEFTIEILDLDGSSLATLPGLNADNDQIPSLTVDVQGPTSLMAGEQGVYMVRFSNTSQSLQRAEAAAALSGQILTIESTPGLTLAGFACSYLSGANCNLQPELTENLLQVTNVDLPAGETLLISIDANMSEAGLSQAVLSAKLTDPTAGISSDNSESTPIAIFRASFEDDG
jgi:hypothetical protein